MPALTPDQTAALASWLPGFEIAADLSWGQTDTVVLRVRNRQYREAEKLEKVDADQDGIPDVYQNRD